MELPVVIVERVAPGSAADKAGLRRGDRLNTYAGQPLTSPAMLQALEENTFGVESVTILGERDGQPWEWPMPPSNIGAEVRPELPHAVLEEYEYGLAAFQLKDYAEAAQIWSRIAPCVQEKVACGWLYWKSGSAAEAGLDWDKGMRFLYAG